MLSYPNTTAKVQKISAEERIKQERMHEVVMLLQHIVEREEVTLKLIIDCLYDIGSVNLVNKRFRQRPLNLFMRAIATMSKPALRVFALRWVKGNLPILVSNWLERRVSFR